MTIAVLKERTKGENRVAVSPNLVGRYADIGQKIRIEKSAGAAAEATFNKPSPIKSETNRERISLTGVF